MFFIQILRLEHFWMTNIMWSLHHLLELGKGFRQISSAFDDWVQFGYKSVIWLRKTPSQTILRHWTWKGFLIDFPAAGDWIIVERPSFCLNQDKIRKKYSLAKYFKAIYILWFPMRVCCPRSRRSSPKIQFWHYI